MVSKLYQICRETGKQATMSVRQQNGGACPAVSAFRFEVLSAQQLQHARLRLVGQRQRRDRDRLTGRQRLAVRRFLVGIGQSQVGRAGLEHVDQVLGEVLPDLHDRQVRTQRRSLRPQSVGRAADLRNDRVRRGVIEEVCAGDQRSKAKPRRVKRHALDGESGLAGLVEDQLEVVAVEQVYAVE